MKEPARIRLIRHGTAEFGLFEDGLERELGKVPADFNAADGSADTLVLGSFEGQGLVAFAILRSFLDPTLHIGGMIDPGYMRSLEELDDVAIFNISLIRTIGGTEDLGEHARLLIGEAERLLLERQESYCLLISLFAKANKKAFPLYRSLGFKKRGGTSYYMDIDAADVPKKYGVSERRAGSFSFRTFDAMDESDLDSLARCYARVFTAGIDGPVKQNIGRIIARRAFMQELSVIVCDDSRDGEVVGFCFIEREDAESVFIDAAGLVQEVRGGGISTKSFSWIMQNCLDHGYRKASLVTASKKLRYVFARAICARPRDSIVWYIKCGTRDG